MGNSSSTNSNLKFNIISDKNTAQQLLNNAEKDDMYLAECHDDKSNSIARRNLTYSPNTILLKDINYCDSFLNGTKNNIPQRLLSDLHGINIIQLMPSADGGMPHTRPGNIICYPDISKLFSNTTLIHELWHIHQRNFKDVWHLTFKRLKWRIWLGDLPEQLEQNRRYNPDTIDSSLWIFDEEWVPIPIFKDISRPRVDDVEIWFYNSNKKYHVKEIPNEIESYFTGLPKTAYEHPREITAYMLSEPDKYKSCQGFKHLIESIGIISIQTKNNHN